MAIEDIKISQNNLLVYKSSYNADEVYSVIRNRKLNGLRIFAELKNDRLDDISFLGDYAFLEELDITSANDFDFSFLSRLVNLKKLTINVEGNAELDLSCLSKLEYLSVQWRKKIKGLDKCIRLSSLGLIEFKEADLAKLTNLKSLIDVRIKTASIETLDGLSELNNLQSLSVGNCKKLVSIRAINELPQLQHLSFDTCPNIKDYDCITSLPVLQSLSLTDCGSIASIKFIESYPLLSKLSLLGNTVITDGDLFPAKRIKSVEHKHYKHYNIKLEDTAYNQTVTSNLQKIKNLFK
jgi:hypothetical protein